MFFLLEKGILDSFPEIFFETIDISTYIFVFILFFLIFKPNLRLDKQKKLKIKDLLVILLIIIAFRIIEDPLQNIDSIINGKNLELIQGDTFKLNNPFYTLFLLVFITPLLDGYSVDIDPPFRDIDPLKDFGGFKRTILLTKLHFFS